MMNLAVLCLCVSVCYFLHVGPSDALKDVERMSVNANGNSISDSSMSPLSFKMKRSSPSSRYQEVSQSIIFDFFKNGFVFLPDLIPSLNAPDIKGDVLQAFHIGKLEYTEFTLKLFARNGFKCEEKVDVDQCGQFHRTEESTLNSRCVDELSSLFDNNIKYLKCCLKMALLENSPLQFYMPYFQTVNGHRISSTINKIATSKHLGKVAASLLQVPSVRLYQTAIFVKNESSVNTNTEWHVDLNMVPIDVQAGGYLTFWCPLNPLRHSSQDSILWFAEGSHRDIARYHWFNELQQLINTEDVKGRYNISSFNLDVGDCTAHHGWTLHAAQSQPKHSNVARVAIGFSYVYTHARVLGSMTKAHPVDRKVPDEDEISYGQWLPDMNQGDPINHPLLPIVFP